MSKKDKKIEVKGTEITVQSTNAVDYISLTDIARFKDAKRTDYIIQNWLRNRNTIEFLGIWEKLNNVNFNPIEFEGFRNRAGLNSFVLTSKQWIEKTNAIGLTAKAGRYGGTYANVTQLVCLSNLENLNAVFINDGLLQNERLIKLNQIAISQMEILLNYSSNKLLNSTE